ncbi:hypothetical protein [Desulfovibrio inopinatus]|nr:hypothetical protein [Desulfovibrio inopinatus]
MTAVPELRDEVSKATDKGTFLPLKMFDSFAQAKNLYQIVLMEQRAMQG